MLKVPMAATSEMREAKIFKNRTSQKLGKFFLGGVVVNTKKIKQEYERLTALFKDVDETKTKLVDELLHKAAFLKVQLDELQEEVISHGAVEYSSKGNSRETPCYKTFLASLGVYQTVIKTLNSIIGKNAIDEDDEFDEFMKNVR